MGTYHMPPLPPRAGRSGPGCTYADQVAQWRLRSVFLETPFFLPTTTTTLSRQTEPSQIKHAENAGQQQRVNAEASTQRRQNAERAAQNPHSLAIDTATIQRRRDIAARLQAFYQPLTGLHLPAEALKVPPKEGWDFVNAERLAFLCKSDAVIDLYKRIRYIDHDQGDGYQIDYYEHIDGEPNWDRLNAPEHIAVIVEPTCLTGKYILVDMRDGKVAVVRPRDAQAPTSIDTRLAVADLDDPASRIADREAKTRMYEQAEHAAQSPRPLAVDTATILRRKVVAAELLSLYEILVELYIPPDTLKRPPKESGWDFVNAERFKFLGKTDAVIDLYKHIPYIMYHRAEYQTSYHSHCYGWTGEHFKRGHLRGQSKDAMEPEQYFESMRGKITWERMHDLQHIALLFEASSNFGRYVVLDTRGCHDSVSVHEYEDISGFVNELRRWSLELELIPSHPSDVVRDFERHWNVEVNNKVKEAYRRHGCPSAGFQKETCAQEIGYILEANGCGAT
ncbi:uncharacterized protein CLAFUR5_20390 [Fulvia fulva]|uniref:uncharacterized protein n=1 Tax=Passalora fulva TaxID=5499 RepID=UPI0028526275|nr:uncharacterized protein CLAFUR5_20390 [Fulvia fulva]WMI39107.1 hypothetical protein CLAFUR5_20390 [Fulvia fulva]